MIFPSHEFDEAVAGLCHGTATDETVATLHELLRGDEAARDEYLWRIELHARLASKDEALATPAATSVASPVVEPARTKAGVYFFAGTGWAAAAVLLLSIALWQALSHFSGPRPLGPDTVSERTVARIKELQNARWVAADGEHQSGEAVAAGQRLELSAGEVHLEFQSGAVVVLKGPAIFDVESENSGNLMLGQLTAAATTAASKGFTIQTRSARVVDLGTEFSANASADGHSRIAVTSGEVEVHLASVKTPHLLREGDVIEVEPGSTQITARIESGDDTAAFHFPTLEPPSALDDADGAKGQATIRCISGRLERQSGPLEVLLDGVGQSNHDVPEESVFFANDQTGRLLLDLGQTVSIEKVNCYSWHRSRGNEVDRVRATQKFMLYGFDGDQAPAADGSLTQSGWVLVARVNTDEYFGATRQNRPAQQAASITGGHGTLGRYRYLLWDTFPTRDQGDLNGTFYGEFDVYASQDD